IWGHLIASFLSYPQALAGMLLIGLIAPALISRDLRTRAYLIYFSKPIGVREYLAGKYLTLIVYVGAITLLPALALFLFGVGLSPDLGVLWDTWDLPIRTMLASLVFMIPTATIALMFSSLTHESRYAAIGWFVFWLLSFASWQTVYLARYSALEYELQMEMHSSDMVERQLPERVQQWLDESESRQQIGEAADFLLQQYVAKEAGNSVWSLLSMYESIRRIQLWLLSAGQPMPVSHLMMVSCVTLFSFVVLVRRVTAPLRL
ncbi:MAG: ABC transporter permease subunit, partial [Planctomycetales bacterium]|nr:ABC transporter permease subunit [Planctomycetales bacterium]